MKTLHPDKIIKGGQAPALTSAYASITYKGACGKFFVPAAIARLFRERGIRRVLLVADSSLDGSLTVVLRGVSDDELEKIYSVAANVKASV